MSSLDILKSSFGGSSYAKTGAQKMGSSAKTGASRVGQGVKSGAHGAMNWLKSGSVMAQIVLAILFICAVLIIVHAIRGAISGVDYYRHSRVWINKGDTLCPKTPLVVPGDQFHRSRNELGGAEFTYAFWIYIEDWSFKYGQWKHVMHKGNSSSWPNRSPGIWLHPKNNTMRFYMNTYNSVAGNFIDVQNIPLNKWFHVTFSVNQLTMDVYINGNLRKTYKFTSLPKQNFGNFYAMAFRGFDGYLSRMVYYSYVIPYSEIEKLIDMGPAAIKCGMGTKLPPYLAPQWWTSTDHMGPKDSAT